MEGRIDKDETLPNPDRKRNQAMLRLVEIEEPFFVTDEAKAALQIERPTMKSACERIGVAATLPRHLVAPMSANVMEGADLVIFAANNDRRGLQDLQIDDSIVTRIWNLVYSRYAEPDTPKNSLSLSFKKGARYTLFSRYRPGTELGMLNSHDTAKGHTSP
jgi:hypothetical protein